MIDTTDVPSIPKHKKQTLYIWLVVVLVIIAISIFFTKPFSREQNQVKQLRTMGVEEQKTDTAASDVTKYIQDEQALKDIDQSLKDFQNGASLGTTTTATP